MKRFLLIPLALTIVILSAVFLYTKSMTNDTVSGEEAGLIKIGTNTWPGYEPLYLAKNLNFFNDTKVRLVEYKSASQVIRAYRNGAINIAALTLDEVIRLVKDGHKVKVILVLDFSEGADVILARSPYESLASLKGRRIGVESTALGAFVLKRACELENLSVDTFNIVPLEVNEQELAYTQGAIDAVVTFEPVRTRLLSAGAREIFSSRRIRGEIVDVLCVNEEVIKKNRRGLIKILQAWFKTLQYMQSDQSASFKQIGNRLQMSEPEVRRSYDGLNLPSLSENLMLLDGVPPALLGTAKKLEEVLYQGKVGENGLDLQSIFDSSLIIEAK